MKRRQLTIQGHTFEMGRHGVIGHRDTENRWDAFYTWPQHGLVKTDEEGKALQREVEAAFDAAGLHATCGKYKTCTCPARF